MKKIKITFLTLVATVAIAFTACGGSNVNYNETVVNLYDRYITQMSNMIGETSSDTDIATKKAAISSLENLTDSCTAVMAKLEPNEDAKGFHEAVTKLYATIKSDFIPVYNKLLAIENPEEDVDEYNKLIDEVNAVSEKVSKLEDEAIKAQTEFAKKVNMKVQ